MGASVHNRMICRPSAHALNHPVLALTLLPVHANVLFLVEVRPIPDTPKTLASTSPSGSVSPKITQKTWQGATPGHRTLPLPNFARCDTTTSHLATLSCRTLQHRAIAPCHFRLSHPATQKARFLPLKSPFSPCASSRRLSAHILNHHCPKHWPHLPDSWVDADTGGRSSYLKISLPMP